MTLPADHAQAIVDLEARHEEMFKLLDDLERRVAGVLGQYQAGRKDIPVPVGIAAPIDTAIEPMKTAA